MKVRGLIIENLRRTEMDSYKNNKHLVAGLIVAITSFILLFVAVKGVLGNQPDIRNILAYIVFSLINGVVISVLVYLRYRIIYIFFTVGLVIGFIELYRTFLKDMAGWGDLIGILSLFMWVITGLFVGILIQLITIIHKKYKK
jgi:membrane-associated HD superfamily phosphohydrolase